MLCIIQSFTQITNKIVMIYNHIIIIKSFDTGENNSTNDADDNDIVQHSSPKSTLKKVKNIHHDDNDIV